MNKYITRDEIFEKLKRGRAHERISKKAVNECINILQKKAGIWEKIKELEKENDLLQQQIEGSALYVLHGGAYCQLLEIFYAKKIK